MLLKKVIVHGLKLLVLFFCGFSDLNALVLLLSRGWRLGGDVLMDLRFFTVMARLLKALTLTRLVIYCWSADNLVYRVDLRLRNLILIQLLNWHALVYLTTTIWPQNFGILLESYEFRATRLLLACCLNKIILKYLSHLAALILNDCTSGISNM